MYDSPSFSITVTKEIWGWKITAICPRLLMYANLEVEVMELGSQDHRLSKFLSRQAWHSCHIPDLLKISRQQ